jgi:uncharacterized protein
MTETRRGGAGRRQRRRWGGVAALAGAALALAACGTATPPRFHSLTPAAPTPTTGKVAPAGPLVWEVLPVSVPPGVDQSQWVVRSADGSLVVLEQERWVGPLAQEIGAAVTAQLTQTLGPPSTKMGPVWRVQIDVLRFETAPGREARLEAVWSLLPGSGDAAAAQRCHGSFVESVGTDGYLALAAGHRRGVAQLADAIAAGLTAAAAGKQAGCTAP